MRAHASLLLFTVAGCSDTIPLEQLDTSSEDAASTHALPELPAVPRHTLTFRGKRGAYPLVPPLRTSADGRVGINDGGYVMRLIEPEQLQEKLLESPPGVRAVGAKRHTGASNIGFANHASSLHGASRNMATLCDGTPDALGTDGPRNPYACGVSGSEDCYDLTIVTTVHGRTPTSPNAREMMEIWGLPIRVRVTDPKSANAAMTVTALSPPVLGPSIEARSMWEPLITRDGHLFVTRLSGSSLTYPTSGGDITGNYDIVYAAGDPETDDPCDVQQWSQFFPVSHAYHDANVNTRYGFAKYPIRDAEGNPLVDGEDLKATYPWIDSKGDNLFFTALAGRFHYVDSQGQPKMRYAATCVPGAGGCSWPFTRAQLEAYEVENTGPRGFGFTGLWSRGKMVLIDGLLNNIDFGMFSERRHHRWVKLYDDPTGVVRDADDMPPDRGTIEMGSGRQTAAGFAENAPDGYPFNVNVIDSTENLLSFDPEWDQGSPRDVVWLMSAGGVTAPVSFDAYLGADTLIASDMNASITFAGTRPDNQVVVHHHDGFRVTAGPNGTVGHGFLDDVHLQNVATTTAMEVPAYGAGVGSVRVEPVALGGIEGKGLWLDGESAVTYDIPQQNGLSARPWYVGIFIDARQQVQAPAQLMRFPNGGTVWALDAEHIAISDGSGANHFYFGVPDGLSHGSGAWNHLGLAIENGGRDIVVYWNGYAATAFSQSSPILTMEAGTFTVGRADPNGLGFRGWIDDLMVIGRTLNPEQACNEARGYLIGIDDDATDYARAAALYPRAAHDIIDRLLRSGARSATGDYYCFHNYTDHHGVPSGRKGDDPRVSEEMLFPEGPLTWDQPRPDSTRNAFCQSCHTSNGRGGLGLGALVYGTSSVVDDEVRRPSLWPRVQRGNLPADFFEPGVPPMPVTLPAEGLQAYDFGLLR